MALMSPKDSWKAAASWLATSKSSGFSASRIACPISCRTMSGLAPENTGPPSAPLPWKKCSACLS